MKDILIPTLWTCLFLLCAIHEATPNARSVRQMWTAIRHAGGARTVFTVARVAVVVVLLILVELCRLASYGLQAVRIVVEALAVHVEILGSLVARTEVKA
ncbi:hypothetical protein [Nonomuraea sp. NPDC003709]|uniref:hypothetical protein n=1 Tax=Nonomuraea sp. NPDC003709 TaxID=3154450 RepID=UPI0033A3E91A